MKHHVVALLTTLALSGQAQAICRQADAKGTWITYQSAYITAPNGQHVGQCKLMVNATGIVDPINSTCKFVTFNTPDLLTSGSIKVNKDCSADVHLDLGPFDGQIQIAKDKNTYSGRFVAQNGAVAGTTNGVKQ
ncbi:MAG: hypothetical protein ACOYLM_09360 [Methylococcaceae bacterium]|jgi:hypothetical protein